MKTAGIELLEKLLSYDATYTEDTFGTSWGVTVDPHYPKEVRLSAIERLLELQDDVERVADILRKSWVITENDINLEETILEGLVELFVRGSNRALIHLAKLQGSDSSLGYNESGKTNLYIYPPQVQKHIRDALMRVPDEEKLFVLLDSNYEKVWKHLKQTTKKQIISNAHVNSIIKSVTNILLPREKAWWVLPVRLYPDLKEAFDYGSEIKKTAKETSLYIGFNPIDLTASHKCGDYIMGFPIGFTDFSQPVNIFGIVQNIKAFNPKQVDQLGLLEWFNKRRYIITAEPCPSPLVVECQEYPRVGATYAIPSELSDDQVFLLKIASVLPYTERRAEKIGLTTEKVYEVFLSRK